MHLGEPTIDAGLVRALLADQFPIWARRALRPLAAAGTDNAVWRLGRDLAIRLPRRPEAVPAITREAAWLPRLAPHLPAPIPLPLAAGVPGRGYPWAWSVVRWLPGRTASPERWARSPSAARDLARFVGALSQIPAAAGPVAGVGNFGRGAPLAVRDQVTRQAISDLAGEIDADAALGVWDDAVRAPPHAGAPSFVHGDLHAGNLLMHGVNLAGVIDFGCLGVGDPACDLMPAWSLFEGESRMAFRAQAGADEAAWRRGRGWALSCAVIAMPYYRTSHPALVRWSRRALAAALADAR